MVGIRSQNHTIIVGHQRSKISCDGKGSRNVNCIERSHSSRRQPCSIRQDILVN